MLGEFLPESWECLCGDVCECFDVYVFPQASHTGAVHIVHVLADRVAQSLLFKSSVFRPQVDLKVGLS